MKLFTKLKRKIYFKLDKEFGLIHKETPHIITHYTGVPIKYAAIESYPAYLNVEEQVVDSCLYNIMGKIKQDKIMSVESEFDPLTDTNNVRVTLEVYKKEKAFEYDLVRN